MADFDLNEGAGILQNIVQQVIFHENTLKKMRGVDVIINSLNDDMKNKVKAQEMKRYLHSFFDNRDFMRKLEMVSHMKTNIELATEYLGQNYLSSPDYDFDEEHEEIISEIEKKISEFLGRLLKELSGDDIEL